MAILDGCVLYNSHEKGPKRGVDTVYSFGRGPHIQYAVVVLGPSHYTPSYHSTFVSSSCIKTEPASAQVADPMKTTAKKVEYTGLLSGFYCIEKLTNKIR